MDAAQYQPGQVLPGTVYRVVRHLATGGMGSVYDVEDVTVEKRYVLKTLHPNLVAREDLALRMRDEAKSLARLQHPNIVDVVTAGVTNDARKMPFYVMERLIGQNLRVVLEKTGVLHVPHAYRIAIDVADALEHAHENNIVHRDVKPENIFLHRNANGTTTTKLLDFGIVRLLDRKASHTHGKFIGTLRYASPEQVTGKKVGPATDIYSLAVVLFEMLAGRGPFDDAGDAYAVGSAHANTPAPPLSRFVRGVSPDVERLVASALAKDPEERPRDCFAFASELRRILREEEASPRSATAVNLLTSASPTTRAEPALAASISDAPTVQGMIPPSMVMSGQPPAIAAP
ncbi:MAG: serine/threonine protein kinase, partial [Labilithrix sp.]|nr:serine/threonine protein kinase [Labilithrix sp.]